MHPPGHGPPSQSINGSAMSRLRVSDIVSDNIEQPSCTIYSLMVEACAELAMHAFTAVGLEVKLYYFKRVRLSLAPPFPFSSPLPPFPSLIPLTPFLGPFLFSPPFRGPFSFHLSVAIKVAVKGIEDATNCQDLKGASSDASK